MSDSVTKSDVEDVLSSIRRLVSDTAKHDAGGAEAAAPAPKPAQPDALVLTSAQRVDEAAQPEADVTPESTPESTPEDSADETALTNLRGALGAAQGADRDAAPDETQGTGEHSIDWPSIAGADEYYEDDEPAGETLVVDFIRHDAAAPSAEPETAQPNPAGISVLEDDDVFSFEPSAQSTDEDPVDETSEAPEEADEAEESVPDETAETAETAAEPEPWSPQLVASNEFPEDALDPPDWIVAGNADIDEAQAETDEDTPEPLTEDALAEDQTHEPAPEQVADIAEDDVANDAGDAGDTAAQPEFDDVAPHVDPQEGEAEFVSAAAASVVDDPAPRENSPEGNSPETAETPKAVDEDAGLADFDEGLIDEDALRDLVSQIVREELTGELGEKITRNVRKLVRREIHRALLTREFD